MSRSNQDGFGGAAIQSIAKTLVDRVRAELAGVEGVEEKKMFGSVGFMVLGKLCVSARESRIMCRIDPHFYDDLLARSGVSPVRMKGRVYRGYVYVDQKALRTRRALRFWVNLPLDYLFAASHQSRRKKTSPK